MNMITSHLWVYFRSLRYTLFVLLIIFLANATAQIAVFYFASGDLVISFPLASLIGPLGGFLLGSLLAVPIMEIMSIPYLLGFNSRRKDILQSSVVLNAMLALFISGLLLLFFHFVNSDESTLPYMYMGMLLPDITLAQTLLVFWFTFCILFGITNLTYFISTIFFRFGIIYGFASIALHLAVVVLSSKMFFQYYMWGSDQFLISLLLLAFSALFIYGSSQIIAKVDNKMPSPKARQSIVLIIAILVFAFSIQYTFHLSDDLNVIYERGSFSYYDVETTEFAIEETFDVSVEKKLYINWRSWLESGTVHLEIKSSTGETIYEAFGHESDIASVPLVPGIWSYTITIEEATNGDFRFHGLLR